MTTHKKSNQTRVISNEGIVSSNIGTVYQPTLFLKGNHSSVVTCLTHCAGSKQGKILLQMPRAFPLHLTVILVDLTTVTIDHYEGLL